MKTLRSLALVILLAGSAYAGDIQNPIAPPLPPPDAKNAGGNPVAQLPGDLPNNPTMMATIEILLESLLLAL